MVNPFPSINSRFFYYSYYVSRYIIFFAWIIINAF